MSFFEELRRRSVFKVGAAYAIVGWLLLQITAVVLPTFQAPLWVAQTITFVIMLGFPLALVLAWAFEVTPKGIRSANQIEPAQRGAGSRSGYGLNYFLLGLIVPTLAFLVVDLYVLDQPVSTTANSPASYEVVPRPDRRLRRYRLNIGPTEPIGNTGLNAHVAIARDGSRITFVTQIDNQSRLYVRDLDQLDTQPLRGTEGAAHPFFSPDGDWIGFYSDLTDFKLKKIAVRGGFPQPLTNTPWAAGGSWTIDDEIIFSTQDDTAQRSVFRISANGNALNTVLHSTSDAGYVWPDVLPDGQNVLYVERPIGGAANDGFIGVVSLETGESHHLIEGGYRPKYSPTGHIVFVRPSGLWAVPFDLGRLETTGDAVLVVEGIQADPVIGGAAYDFSDDGTLVYIPGGGVSGLNNLVWVGGDGAEELLTTEPGLFSSPRLSPLGNRLAAEENAAGNTDLWVFNLVDGTRNRLTSDPTEDRIPVWTPDGLNIVFNSNRGGNGLFLKSADGAGQVERLTSSDAIQFAEDFSPNGELLVYREEGTQENGLYVLSMVGDERTSSRLIEPMLGQKNARISPDGRWIAYESPESGRQQIIVRPFPNVDDGWWQASLSGGHEPVWGPSGNELYYRLDSGQIVMVSVETGAAFSASNPTIFIGGSYPQYFEPSYDLGPNGQRAIVLKAVSGELESTGEEINLVVVENWFAELGERLLRPN